MVNMTPGNAGFGRRLEAEQEALQRARLQHGSGHAEVPRRMPRNRVSDWFNGHPVATIGLISAGALTAFIVLLS